MCGFVAFLQDQPTIDLDTAQRALGRIAHRGPDAAGEWREREVILLHRRLSIIDLHTGQQPMQSHDGRYVVVFNGEIYNFPELRQQLEQEGCRFQTHSDTEVILQGYRAGKRCGRPIEGDVRFCHLGSQAPARLRCP